MELVGALVQLAILLLVLLLTVAVISFIVSIPGWLTGFIAESAGPQFKTVRRRRFYWSMWMLFGTVPFAIGVTGGPFASTGQFLPTPVAVALIIGGIVVLNVNSFFIGYKSGLSAKAKRDVRKSLTAHGAFAGAHTPDTPDLLNENHPAIAPTPTPTKPLPAVDADHPTVRDAPTQETPVHGTVPPDDEYPLARPHGD